MGLVSTLALGVFGLFIAYVVRTLLKGQGDGRPLPPGPKGLPIVGNVSDMPKPGVLECHHWLEHKDKYGPISSVTVLGQTMVILNDTKVAFELLRDRSNIYSSRPHQNFSCDLVGWKNAAAMSPYNEYWKSLRKNITQVASTNVSVSVFDRVQEEEAAHFLMNMLDSPDKLFDHIRTEAGTVILKITYGYIAKNRGKDALVDLVGKAMWTFAESTVTGKWAIDMFPFLKYLPDGFPGTAYRKTGREMRQILTDCAEKPYAFVKKQMAENRARTSFLSQAIETQGTDPYMEHVHKWTALSLFTGGADTTVSSLMTFFLAMTLYPDVQKRAQEELDRVIGSSRLPVAADKDSLPYIHAVMLETHRWHPVTPMGLPHMCDADDVCQGYRIPKGAILLPNTWWFTHDPAVYPDPMTFNPDRFLETATHKPEPDPRNYIFGYGRRICPGRYVADNALFITIAQSLAVFNVTPTAEKPELKFEPGVISHPIPYKTNIQSRSEAHRRLIEQSEEKYPWEQDDAREMEKIL
ncbi:cytochrome P450 [Bimuria novae-zelandiae CBS 107.79]|uniref:Cytochrome P450 n=1 Tax=Bimuria novae-zelandiae CBS 107.79 TaxID=1447943 RepID=A0A6A5VHD1_9PLEO|nr:cytochrome P450 [Bimuria novae-zelandiae CBS 107.79]